MSPVRYTMLSFFFQASLALKGNAAEVLKYFIYKGSVWTSKW